LAIVVLSIKQNSLINIEPIDSRLETALRLFHFDNHNKLEIKEKKIVKIKEKIIQKMQIVWPNSEFFQLLIIA
jgi:hypothetical protein